MLRFEHFEEKRHLKLKAIQNVLIKCQAKDGSGEALQMQALIEDLKKQKSTNSQSQTNAGKRDGAFFSETGPKRPGVSYRNAFVDNEQASQDKLFTSSYIEACKF